LRAHAIKQFGTTGCADAFSRRDETKEKGDPMKKLALGAIAAGALVAATAVPALAQVDVYAGPRGVGVDIGAPGYHDGPGPYHRGYYNHAPGWNGDVRAHRHHDWHGYRDDR
jgi:hypothetical protein